MPKLTLDMVNEIYLNIPSVKERIVNEYSKYCVDFDKCQKLDKMRSLYLADEIKKIKEKIADLEKSIPRVASVRNERKLVLLMEFLERHFGRDKAASCRSACFPAWREWIHAPAASKKEVETYRKLRADALNLDAIAHAKKSRETATAELQAAKKRLIELTSDLNLHNAHLAGRPMTRLTFEEYENMFRLKCGAICPLSSEKAKELFRLLMSAEAVFHFVENVWWQEREAGCSLYESKFELALDSGISIFFICEELWLDSEGTVEEDD